MPDDEKEPQEPRKRGPKEERLIIEEDADTALQKLFQPKKRKDGDEPESEEDEEPADPED
jgi:hypothetical protein